MSWPTPPHSPQRSLSLATVWSWEGSVARPEEVAVLRLTRERGGLRVEVSAPLHGDPAPAQPPGPTWALWEHEVVELFVAGPGEDDVVAYTELELGPHGHHLLLTLRGRRQLAQQLLPVELLLQAGHGRWGASAWIAGEHLPEAITRVNACAIHGQGTARRYLSATPLPGAAPDFHQPQRFRAVPAGW